MDNDSLEYGAVIFTKDEHKDKLGYYDNDDDEGNKALVYLGKPFESNYILVSHDQIRNITTIEHERFKKDNPEFSYIMGIK